MLPVDAIPNGVAAAAAAISASVGWYLRAALTCFIAVSEIWLNWRLLGRWDWGWIGGGGWKGGEKLWVVVGVFGCGRVGK